MKAVVSNRYGSPDVLEFTNVVKPIPKNNQVLVKIHAASLNYGNIVLLKGEPLLARFAFGFLRPKYSIPGGDIAGRVEAIGKDVKKFQPGDEVFGDLSGFGWGGFAEYVSVPENALVLKPNNLSFEEAAAVPMAGVTALQSLRDIGQIKKGQRVLIYGASGGVGTFAVQIAKSYGAEVTGVCSTRNINILRSIKSDHAIDYKVEDFTKRTERYDLILAVNGSQSIFAFKRALSPNGIYVNVGGSKTQLFQAMILGPLISVTGRKKMLSFLHTPKKGDLIYMKELLEKGKVKPVIDRCFKLSELKEAFRYFEEGHAQGKIVISI